MRCPALSELPQPLSGRAGWPWTEEAPRPPETMPDGRPWPRLSVVTPSFNQGAFVEEAIRSVLLQGYPGVELVVVDGGSTDGSIETIRKYEPWLKGWVCERDAGPADALNKGFRLATGEILGVLNADDFYLPRSLRKIAREFQLNPSADVVSGHGYHARPSGELGTRIYSDRWNPRRFAYGTCVLVQQATFFRRRTFQETPGFDETLQTCWDMALWAEMAKAGARFHVFDEFLSAFRLHADSITGNPTFTAQCWRETSALLRTVRGRPDTAVDWALRLFYRLRKFSTHPRRTLRQRLFLYSTLGRWSL